MKNLKPRLTPFLAFSKERWAKLKAVDPFATTEPEGCRVVVLGQSYDLDLEQSQNAAIITAETIRRGLPTRAAAIALTTAMQESKLRNIDYGDRQGARPR